MNRFSPYAVLLLRIAVGGVFLAHGIAKLQHGISGLTVWLHDLGFPVAAAWAVALVTTETLGATCVIAGLFTRFWSLCLAVVVAMAILRVKLPNHGNIELELLLFAAALAIALQGDGPFALGPSLRRGD